MSSKSDTTLRPPAARVRTASRAPASGRPRLSVFRSSKHIYAQIIDDARARTLAAASTLDKALRERAQDRRRQGRGRGASAS